ncbi:hypothetical protein ZYGR_0AE00100 [Zygosaccharomyces rouxii]|uniref:Uncharacterized protein n=1 Tax=Zygosaccharomyces rouxii TaxID=4956 RepID=A0A1Q3A7E5_ZYGRO|nr:hypothetical protein ZYGR_0AE00100 [Zygosaccharomyces rouxii]
MNAPGIVAKYSPIQTHVDLEDLALPRDIFTCRFHHFLATRPYFTSVLLTYTANICICSVWLMITGLTLFPFFDLVLTVSPAFLPLSILAKKRKGTSAVKEDPRNCLSFFGEVVKFQPGLDIKKWDPIAARLNKIFHDNNSCITPYFFYDGSDCHSCFKRWYFDPYENKSNADAAHINESDNTVASKPGNVNTNESNSANVDEYHTSRMQPMLREAVKAYKDSLEEYWRQYIESPSETLRVTDQSDVSNESSNTERISMADF